MKNYKDGNQKSFHSQQIVYKALRAVLKTKPLSSVTISDIISEAQISRSTFYRNFNSVGDVLEFAFEWFYNDYNQKKVDIEKDKQLLFFLQYWYYHRDLITIISSQNSGIIKSTMKRYESKANKNEYLFDIKYSILTSILSTWSEYREDTPEELEKKIWRILEKPAIELLLE